MIPGDQHVDRRDHKEREKGADGHSAHQYKANRIAGRGASGYRALRGGSWISGPRDIRSASRSRYSADIRNFVLGFRPARSP